MPQTRSRTKRALHSALRFPSERLATFTLSFGAAKHSSYRVVGTKGELFLEPAYEPSSAS